MAYPDRLKTIIGNWKMNKTIAEAKSFVSKLALSSYSCRLGLAVPFTVIAEVAAEVADIDANKIMIGAQDVAPYKNGAYTGEISSSMLKDAGASFSIIGHSERRTLFSETNEAINKKAALLLESGLMALICIGESEDDHKASKTEDVLNLQLMECLKGLSPENISRIMIAYEPLWAIGTGKSAKSENIQAVLSFCKKTIAKAFGTEAASQISILYGGSVNPDNAKELLKLDDVDGLLVGGSSLALETFDKILRATS